MSKRAQNSEGPPMRSSGSPGWLSLATLAGVAVVAALLIYEHRLVRPGDLTRLDAAFFNMNGYISVTIFLFTLVDALVAWG